MEVSCVRDCRIQFFKSKTSSPSQHRPDAQHSNHRQQQLLLQLLQLSAPNQRMQTRRRMSPYQCGCTDCVENLLPFRPARFLNLLPPQISVELFLQLQRQQQRSSPVAGNMMPKNGLKMLLGWHLTTEHAAFTHVFNHRQVSARSYTSAASTNLQIIGAVLLCKSLLEAYDCSGCSSGCCLHWLHART